MAISASLNPIGKALCWLYPWDAWSYPGLIAGVMWLLRGRATWGAVKHWRDGRRRVPEWAATVLADYIEARASLGLAIVAELRQIKDPLVRKPRGWQIVDPATGLNRAYRVGRNQQTKPSTTGIKDNGPAAMALPFRRRPD